VTVWHERDPPGSSGMPYLEEWRRLDGDGGGYFAARCGDSLLVVAGDWFGYAEDSRDRAAVLAELDADESYDTPGAGARLASSLASPARVKFVAGRRSTGWLVDVSAAGGGEGERLTVGSSSGWWLAEAGSSSSLMSLARLLMSEGFIATDCKETGLPIERVGEKHPAL
jgi:hypothetical protein